MSTDVTTINVGLEPNDGKGEAVRDAFIKVNTNFANIDTRLTEGNLPVVFSNTIQANVSFTGGGTLTVAGVSTLDTLNVNTSTYTTNFSTGNAVITGGYLRGLSNVYSTLGQFTNFSSGNILVTGGTVSGITGQASTLVVTNFSTANAQITGGALSGITSLTATTGSFSSHLYVLGNLVVSGNVVSRGESQLVVQDSIINLNSTPDLAPLTIDDGKDIGIKFHYFKGVDGHAFLGRANDTGYLEYYAAGTEAANVFTGTAYGTIKSGELLLANSTASTSTSTGALRVTGGGGIGGDLYVGGFANVAGSVQVTGAVTSASLSTGAGSISGGSLSITNGAGIGTLQATNFSTANAQITGGAITGITLNASTLTATNFSTGNAVITGGSLNGTIIGNATAAAGSFTTIAASANVTLTSNLVLSNTDVFGVNTIHIADPGTNEGILWDGGNGWGIFEAPDTYSDAAGNLQFDHGGTRVLTLNTSNQIDIPGATDASSSTTGALKVAGGVGIAKKLYVGTAIVPSTGNGTNGIIFPSDPGGGSGDVASVQYYAVTGESTVLEIKVANDATDFIKLNASGNVLVSNTDDSTSKTTGAFQVAGGVGVSGNIWSNRLYTGDLFFANGATVSSVISNAVTSSISTNIDLAGTTGTGTVSTGGTLTFAGTYGVTATASSSTITVGTPQDLRTTASPTFSNVTASNNISVTGNISTSRIAVSNTAASTSKITGALTVSGGAGISGNVWTGNVYADNVFFANGSTLSSVISSAVSGSISTNFNLAGTSGTGSVNGGGTITFGGSYGVTATVSSSTITIDTPQDLRTDANVSFFSVAATGGTASTSKTTGAVVITGGLGVSGNARVQNVYADNLFFSNGATVASVVTGGVTGYTLPTATTSVLGGVKIDGTTITIATDVISTAQDIRTTASPQFAGLTLAGNVVPNANVTYNLGSTSMWWNNMYGTAVHALYADLAENYAADAVYEPGTVLIFGGEQEVTACTTYCDGRVAGAVSTNPAYLMNSALENGTPIALRGRVPVKVVGTVSKGDFLVTSETPGHAVAVSPNVNYGPAVFAKAIQNKTDDAPGVVEAVIL